MSVDLKKLRENLENLTGRDYMEIARVSGMNINLGLGAVLPVFDREFQARVAAKALGMSYDEILDLKLRDFSGVLGAVFVFLVGSMVKSQGGSKLNSLKETVEAVAQL